MKPDTQRQRIVLAVSPSVRGFGFALFEGPRMLIDWGMRYVKKDKNKKCATKVDELVAEYNPDMLLIEDWAAKGCRRKKRIRRLLRLIERCAKKRSLKTLRYSRRQIQQCFAQFGGKTKFEIAKQLADWLPELRQSLPPKRKAWNSEHPYMAVFDATAWAITHFHSVDPDIRPGKDASR